MKLNSEVFFEIYDMQIAPTLLYESEIRGYQTFDVLEKVPLFACKIFLVVSVDFQYVYFPK